MPVEIGELEARAILEAPQTEPGVGELAPEVREQIISEAIKRVLQVLKDKQEL